VALNDLIDLNETDILVDKQLRQDKKALQVSDTKLKSLVGVIDPKFIFLLPEAI